MGLIKSLMVFSVLLPFIFLGTELYMSRFKEYKPTQLGINQPQLSKLNNMDQPLEIIKREEGVVRLSGWDTDIEDKLVVNHFYACPLSSSILPLNKLKFRSWNYFLLNTPTHIIQFIFTDLGLGCTSNIIIFEIGKDPQKTLQRAESLTCPIMDTKSLGLGDGTLLTANDFEMKVERVGTQGSQYKISIDVPQVNLKLDLDFDFTTSQGLSWVIPFSNDKTTYLANMKKPTVPSVGSYRHKGKEYQCKNNDCLLMMDFGRGHHNYGVAHFWALFQTTLKDGRRVGVSLGDGFGSEYKSLEKASEDFLVIDGKFYKLDVTEMVYSKEDYLQPKKLMTATENQHYKKQFKERKCEIDFKPVGLVEEGINGGLIAFKQYLTYGFFNGHCQVEGGDIIKIESVFGHVEHVFSRW